MEYRPLFLTRGGQESATRDGCTVSVHPLLGRARAVAGAAGAPRLAGGSWHRGADPGWPITRSMARLRFPGPPIVRWPWPRLVRFSAKRPKSAISTSSRCCCSMSRPRSAPSQSVTSPGIANFAVETFPDGARIRHATAVLHVDEDNKTSRLHTTCPHLLAAHSRRLDGDEMRRRLTEHGVQYGPAFSGLVAAHIADGDDGQHGAGRSGAARFDSFATARLRHASRAAGCLFSVGRGSSRHPGRKRSGLLVALGVRRIRVYASARGPPTTAMRA